MLTSLTNLGLSPLGLWGGTVETMALLPGSAAIGRGTNVSGLNSDERGEPHDRPGTDIGAFQSQGFTLTAVADSTGQSTSTGSAFANPLAVTVTPNNAVEPVAGGIVTFTAPSSGASAALSGTTATFGSNGVASVTATANATAGRFQVNANVGTELKTQFQLTNLVALTFSKLTNPNVNYGSNATFAGSLTSSTGPQPGGSVLVTVDGISQSAAIHGGGAFSVTLNTASLPVSSTPYSVSYSYTGDQMFASAGMTAQLTVSPAPLIITVANATSTYGGALPAFTVSYNGFVNSETVANLTTAPSLSTTATSSSPVVAGGYPITASGAVDPNYTITYMPGTLTINPAPLTIAAVNASNVYGAALPAFTVSYAGFVNGDIAASLTTAPSLSTTATASSPVAAGGYAIAASGAVDPNYDITYVTGTLTITPAPLTIVAASATKVYGAALPALSVIYSSFVNGDTAASLTAAPSVSTTAAASSPVAAGGYAITASGAVDPNYAITYVAGTLTITQAPLTIVAASATKVYGAALPALSVIYSSFVNGDTSASLTAAPSVSTTAAASSPVAAGGYAITASGAVDANYAITYVAGTLTITPAPLTITAASATKVYGAALPAFAATYSNFVNGDTAASLTTAPSFSTSATAASPVVAGGYVITASEAVDANYAITYTAGTLTITPAPLTITASNATKVYGAAPPDFSASYSGFVNGDSTSSLTTAPSFSTTATAASPVSSGGYAITASAAVDDNYGITYTAGTLTITPASLTVTAGNATKVYGAALPAFSANYTGFVNGDSAASLSAAPTFSTTATAASPVSSGGYPITAAGAVDGNYTITYAAGTLTITPASLTIAAANATKVYGAALPAFSANYTGFVNGDSSASLTTAPSFSTTATAASPVTTGGYTITASGAVDANYAVTYVPGTLTITAAAPAVSVSAPGGGFDGSPFPASVTIAGSGNANTPAASLEDVTPVLTYYAGSETSGTNLGSSPPTAPGSYTVVARFPGSTDYAATQSAPITFTIDQATSTLALTPSGGSAVYGQAVTFVATVTAPEGPLSATSPSLQVARCWAPSRSTSRAGRP